MSLLSDGVMLENMAICLHINVYMLAPAVGRNVDGCASVGDSSTLHSSLSGMHIIKSYSDI